MLQMLFLLAGGKTFRFHFCAVVKNLDGILSAVQYWLPHPDRDCISRTLISRFNWTFHVFLIRSVELDSSCFLVFDMTFMTFGK